MPGVNHEVLIPVVGAGGGALLRAVARNERPPTHPAGLDPVISELNDHGLYQVGLTAWAALRRCGQRRSGWLAARETSLGVANPGDVPGLTQTNARSAELGLALALALQRADSPLREVIATGALDSGGNDRAVPILPVAHLDQKLKLIAAEFRQPGAAPVPPMLLLPRLEPDGTPVEIRHADALAELARLGIAVRVVDTLTDALSLISAQRLARHPAETLMKRSAALVLLVGIALAGGWTWLARPIEARFVPVTLPDGATAITPLRVRPGAQGIPEALHGCPAGPATRLATGEALAIRFVTAPHAPSRWLGMQAAVVAVGSVTGVKVLPLSPILPADHTPGDVSGFIAEIADPAQENLLAILLRPGRPFDLAALEARLRERVGPLDPAVRLSVAENLLRTMAPGALIHRFTTTGALVPCD